MLPCSEAYIESLKACKIGVTNPARGGATWISSVYGEDASDYLNILKDEYWNNNMVSPVLFSQALEFAIAEKGPFDLAIECGLHPALKGPALQVIQEVLGGSIPYTGMLSRTKNDREAFAEGLGYIWQAFGENAVDYLAFDRYLAGPDAPRPRMIPDLPAYAWDHERIFWHESRQSTTNRTKPDASHQLLGTLCPDGTQEQLRWRNMLRPKEIPWLSGHQIQGQMVFPAAGYLSTALEAAWFVTRGRSMKLIEIEDFVIGQAIAFNSEYSSVEIQFVMTDIAYQPDSMTARFSYYSASTKDLLRLDLNASGKISVSLNDFHEDVLPPNPHVGFGMLDVSDDQFYESLSKLGFGYNGPFRALRSLKRKLGQATGIIQNPASSDPAYDLLVHPATIQSIILAYCYLEDGRLWSVHLPTHIKKMRVNPALCEISSGIEARLHFKSEITSERSAEIEGDVDIYGEDGQSNMLQLQGLHTKPLAHATAANDSPLFLETVWGLESPDRESAMLKKPNLEAQSELSFDIERVACHYLCNLEKIATPADRDKAEWHHKIFFEYIDHTLATIRNGTARFAKQEWIDDTYEKVQSIIDKYPESIDMKLMRAVGEHLVPVIRGETTMLEYMREDDMLNEFYVSALGFQEYTDSLADQVSQFGHVLPNMNVLEIGAGTGGATKRVLKKLGHKFGGYTYTDISTGFFEKAQEVFEEYESKMTFKALNIEKDPVEQGFVHGSYDLIIASLVLHATHVMETTMANVRRLLKPGGHLIMLEFVDHEQMRSGLIFGPLPGWWMGYDDGRKLSPCMSEDDWTACLQKTGFSGVDAIVPRQDALPISLAVITGQAIDDHVNFLRDPSAPSSLKLAIPHLLIVGGATAVVEQLIVECQKILEPFYQQIIVIKTLADLETTEVPFMGTVLCLADLDEPIFMKMSEGKLKGLQQLFERTKNCMWIRQGARHSNPYHNMSIGFSRTVNLEMDHLRLECVDFGMPNDISAEIISKRLLQLEAIELWDQSGQTQSPLWRIEPEVAYESGNFLVPRLMPNSNRNARYNSRRRQITKEMNPNLSALGLCRSGNLYRVVEKEALSGLSAFDGKVEISVSHSTIKAIRVTSTDSAYLVLGTNPYTKEQVFALSPERHSIVRVHASWTVPYQMALDDAVRLLPILREYLLANAAIADFSSGETIGILEPSDSFAYIISRVVADKNIGIVKIATTGEVKDQGWVKVHPRAPARVMRSTVPTCCPPSFICRSKTNLPGALLSVSPQSARSGVETFSFLRRLSSTIIRLWLSYRLRYAPPGCVHMIACLT